MSASLLQRKKSRKAKDPNRVKKAPNAYIEYSRANNKKVRGQLAKKNPKWTDQQLFEATGKKLGADWQKRKPKAKKSSKPYSGSRKKVTTKKRVTTKKKRTGRSNNQKLSLESLLRYY